MLRRSSQSSREDYRFPPFESGLGRVTHLAEVGKCPSTEVCLLLLLGTLLSETRLASQVIRNQVEPSKPIFYLKCRERKSLFLPVPKKGGMPGCRGHMGMHQGRLVSGQREQEGDSQETTAVSTRRNRSGTVPMTQHKVLRSISTIILGGTLVLLSLYK